MKKILVVLAITAFTAGFAQENEMKKTETTVTKTTVVDNKGIDVSTKAVQETEKQSIAIEGQIDRTNFDTTVTPVMSNSEVSYSHNGVTFAFQSDDNGYKLMTLADNMQNEYALIRPSAREGYYICSQDGVCSMGYFDKDGNFVVESYDADNDAVISTIYKLQAKTVVNKN